MLEKNILLKNLFNDSFFDFPSIVGDFKTEEGNDKNGKWIKESFTSKDGNLKIFKFYQTSNDENIVNNNVNKIKRDLNFAIENQDFEKAIILRDKLKNFNQLNDKILSLNNDLQVCINNQDFEKAIIIRNEINKLKNNKENE